MLLCARSVLVRAVARSSPAVHGSQRVFSFNSLVKYGPLFSLNWTASDVAAKLNIHLERRVKALSNGAHAQLPRFGFDRAHLVNTPAELVILPQQLGKDEEAAAIASFKPSVQSAKLLAVMAPLTSDMVFNAEWPKQWYTRDGVEVRDSDFMINLRHLAGTEHETSFPPPEPAWVPPTEGALDQRPANFKGWMRWYVDQLLNSFVHDSFYSLVHNQTKAEREALPYLSVDSIGTLSIVQGGKLRSAKPGVHLQALHIERAHNAVALSHVIGWIHKPNNASGSTDLAQMTINGAMAAVKNRQAVSQPTHASHRNPAHAQRQTCASNGPLLI